VTVINGLPAHVLLVHFIVVLAPVTAISAILCALWPAARQRLVWPTLVLAVVTLALTPLTTDAGGWLYDLRSKPSPLLREHAELGDTMIYGAVGLLIVAALVAFVHTREHRHRSVSSALRVAVAVLTVVVGASTIVQVYRIGDSGAQSVWGDEIAHLTKPNARD
jgi:membrane-associated PAP2 superfamily phosphatase